ncbi:hypothetical protein ACSBR1_003171 [Camellia fascicularis]
MFETFNQHIAEKEMKKTEREEEEKKRIQALQEMNELEIKKKEHLQKMKELDVKKKEHFTMIMDISHLDTQTKVYYIMRKKEIFIKWSAHVSSLNYYFLLPPNK